MLLTICSMKKHIVAYDVETTGLNPQKDFIIQLVLKKIDSKSLEVIDTREWYIQPIHTYEISAQAQEKHGITKEFLKTHGVSLKDIAQEVLDFFEDCDVLTYNGNSFDVSFLYSNLKQVGYEFDISDRIFYDAFLMYKKLHPSTLEAVYEYYTGKELEGAHNAFNDVDATIEIFKHLHQGLGDKWEGLTRDEMTQMDENKIYSPEKSITIRKEGDEDLITFANGKHKDEEFMKVCKQDPSYIKWFMESVATDYTKKILREYYSKHRPTK